MIKINSGVNAYNEIGDIIEKWCDENFYDTMIVSILADGDIETEILEYSAADGFMWLNDWNEGQQDITLLGFIPLSNLTIDNISNGEYYDVKGGKRICIL